MKTPCATSIEQQALFVCGCNRKPGASAFQTFPAINKMKKNHGVLALIGWGILLPSGSIIARYYRHRDPLWYYLHTFIQFVGFLIGLAAVVAGKLLYDKMHAKVSTHRG